MGVSQEEESRKKEVEEKDEEWAEDKTGLSVQKEEEEEKEKVEVTVDDKMEQDDNWLSLQESTCG